MSGFTVKVLVESDMNAGIALVALSTTETIAVVSEQGVWAGVAFCS